MNPRSPMTLLRIGDEPFLGREMSGNRSPLWAHKGFAVTVTLLTILAQPLWGHPRQEAISVRVQTPNGPLTPALSIVTERGFPAVEVGELSRLGWSVSESDGGVVAY